MEREWRCKECSTLLGCEKGSRLHLRHKRAQYIVDGDCYMVMAVCRTCSAVSERGKDKKTV